MWLKRISATWEIKLVTRTQTAKYTEVEEVERSTTTPYPLVYPFTPTFKLGSVYIICWFIWNSVLSPLHKSPIL